MNKSSPEVYKILLEILKNIRDSGPKLMRSGICENVYQSPFLPSYCTDIICSSILKDLFKKWPKFSGDINFPIRDPSRYSSAEIHYYYIQSDGENPMRMWSRTEEYGKLRWELLDFMIEELEKENVSKTGL